MSVNICKHFSLRGSVSCEPPTLSLRGSVSCKPQRITSQLGFMLSSWSSWFTGAYLA